HSLHRKFSEAKGFYIMYSALVALAAGIVLIPHAPLGLITLGVQALAGILLPSATVFLLFLCNDKEVLGPWTNGPVINAISSLIVGVLVMLSLILAATTMFPVINVTYLTIGLGMMLVLGLLGTGFLYLKTHKKEEKQTMSLEEKMEWRMPPLELLKPSVWSAPMKIGMLVLRGYLLIAVVLMVVKVIQLAIVGH
ncbi:MAG: divalent metal cation transporter, partial [Patescibacteria group bacterium]|nr:divalent metal cation transporter [Patescibacteria group bacterium]